MFFSFLADEASPNQNQWVTYVLIGVLVVVLVVSMVIMNRRSKKREQDAQKLIDAVKPGNKVKTIGGICGIVVEVDPEEDTFVLETGTESSGKSYMKFVRQAILESDAVVETTDKGSKKDVSASADENKSEEGSKPEVEGKDVAETTEAIEVPAEQPLEEAKPAEDKSDKE